MLLQYFGDRVADLLRSQKIAARESKGFLHSLKGINLHNDHFNSLLYNLDTGTKPADTLEALKTQNKNIEDSNLQWFEKNYIEQKNIVRYFGQKLSKRDLGQDIAFHAVNPMQDTYAVFDNPPYTNTGSHYSGVVSALGSLNLARHGSKKGVFGNPQAPWSNSGESVVPDWLYKGKIMGEIPGVGKKLDYIAYADKLRDSTQEKVVAPNLKKPSFKPSDIWKESNKTPLEKSGKEIEKGFLGFELKEESTKKTVKFKGVMGKGGG